VKRPRLWPGIIFALLGAHLCVVVVTAIYAGSDRSFAVESDYYQKALKWDSTQRQNTHNRDLGWTVRVGTEGAPERRGVTVRLADRDGTPVRGASVRVGAFHNARANDRLEAVLEETAPGTYGGTMDLARPGRWQFRISALRGTDTFTAAVEQSVGMTPGEKP
jgi:nitrogen fixation protein FixH